MIYLVMNAKSWRTFASHHPSLGKQTDEVPFACMRRAYVNIRNFRHNSSDFLQPRYAEMSQVYTIRPASAATSLPITQADA